MCHRIQNEVCSLAAFTACRELVSMHFNRGLTSLQNYKRASPFTRILVREGGVALHLEGLQLIINKQRALICSLPGNLCLQEAKAPLPEEPAVKDLVSRLRIGAFVEGCGFANNCSFTSQSKRNFQKLDYRPCNSAFQPFS